jgi:acyl dehydratase
MDAVELDAMPDLGPLLARAGAGALPSLPWQSSDDEAAGPGLPDTQVVVRDVPMELAAVADYADVCGFRLRSDVPVTFPHVLGFPLSVWLMTRDDFPHPLLGLVHLREQIVAREPLPIGARVDLAAHVVNERAHRKGVQFDVVVQARRDGRVVWASTSTHLRRGASLPDTPSISSGEGEQGGDVGRASRGARAVDLDHLPTTARWKVPADIGRRYAAVSGDRNPIHLTAVTAKAFGFPRAIAHGMWTTAHALAGLGSLPRPCTVDVAFRRPLLLPSTVEYATLRTGDGWDFGVRGVDGTHHLVGRVT